MKQLLTIILSLFYILLFAQHNDVIRQTNPGNNVNVRTGPGLGYSILGSIAPGKLLYGYNPVDNPNNGTSNDWYRVYLPSSTSPSNNTYVSAGSKLFSYDCDEEYFTVKSSVSGGLNVRCTSSTGCSVFNSGSAQKLWPGQKFPIVDDDFVGGYTWYKFDLPNYYSQNSGWVRGDFVNVSGNSDICVDPAGLSIAVNGTTATITWDATIGAPGFRLRFREIGSSWTSYDYEYDWDTIQVITGLSSGNYEACIQTDCTCGFNSCQTVSFTIGSTSAITISNPTSTDVWKMGNTYNLAWNDNFPDDVDVVLYKNGSPILNIATSTSSDGSYNWTIPGNLTPDDDYRILIVNENNSTVYDFSDEFEIIPSIHITSPTSATTWIPNGLASITWDSYGINASETVQIIYSPTGNNPYSTLISTTSNDGTFTFIVPSGWASGNYRIAIRLNSDLSIYDISDQFTVDASQTLQLTYPVSTTTWQAGDQETVTWTSTGISPTEIVYLRINTGSGFTTLAGPITNDGSEIITVPSQLTTNAILRIVLASNQVVENYVFGIDIINNCNPVAAFDYSPKPIIDGIQVSFTDESLQSPTSYNYQFEDGSPATSSAQNPLVTFSSSGSKTVVQTVSNSSCGQDVESKEIKVFPNLEAPVPFDMARASGYPTVSVGDPVLLPFGDYVLNMRLMSLYGIGGEYPLYISYNSGFNYDGPLGHNFTHNYNYKLDLTDPDESRVRYPDGSLGYWVRFSDSTAVKKYYGIQDSLYYENGSYKLLSPSGNVVEFDVSSGQPQKMLDRFGKEILFTYASNKLSRITIPGGRYWDFVWSGNYVDKIIDVAASREVDFNIIGSDLMSITNVRGKTTNFQHQNHQITQMTDPKGNLVVSNVYTNGRVTSQNDINGASWTFQYEFPSIGNITVTRPNGSTNIFYHDIHSRIYATTDAYGHKDSTVFNKYHVPVDYYDKKGVKLYHVDYSEPYSMPTSITNVYGDSVTYLYGIFNTMVGLINTQGDSTLIQLDSLANPLQTKLPNGAVVSYNFNNSGVLQDYTSVKGLQSTIGYDAYGDIQTVNTPTGIMSFSNNTWGAVNGYTDRNGQFTSFTQNKFGANTSYTDANGNSDSTIYDNNGNPKQYTDREGTIYNTDFNLRDLPIAYYVNGNLKSTIIWNAFDLPTSVRDAYGAIIDSFVYDLENRVEQYFNGTGTYIFIRDENGAVEKVIDPGNKTWDYERDSLSRIVKITDPNGDIVFEQTFNSQGNVDALTDGKGFSTEFISDEMSLLTEAKDALNGENVMSYNKASELETLTNANNKTYEFHENANGTADTLIFPNGKKFKSFYGNELELTSSEDANGLVGSYIYDAVYNRTNANFSNSSWYKFRFNKENQLLSANYNGDSTTFELNEVGIPVSWTDHFQQKVDVGLDDNYLREYIVYPGGDTVWIERYSNRQIKKVTSWNGSWMGRTYDIFGRENITTFSNGVKSTKTYTFDGFVKDYVIEDSIGTILYECHPLYDEAGNLIDKGVSNHPISPDFSSMLNQGSSNFSYGDASEQTQSMNWVRTFDNNGTIISETNSITGVTNAFHSKENGLIDSVTYFGNSFFNQFDAFGNRISRIENGIETRFVLDLGNRLDYIIRENNSANQAQRSYVYFGEELGWMIDDQTGETFFYGFDVSGNTTMLHDESAVVVQRYAMTPFGAFLNAVGSVDQDFIFLGMYGVVTDHNSLIHMRARYFTNKDGVLRAISVDPVPMDIANTQSVMRYHYGYNNPNKWMDPTGLYSEGVSEDKLDQIESGYNKMIKRARILGFDVAASNLEHFLNGGGSPIDISLEWLQQFDLFNHAVNVNLRRFEGTAKVPEEFQDRNLVHQAGLLKDGESSIFNDYWENTFRASPFSELYYASGTSTINSTGTFSLTRKKNKVYISGTVSSYWSDPYDWHLGLAARIPGFGNVSDGDALLLEAHRGAEGFKMRSRTFTHSFNSVYSIKNGYFLKRIWN